MGKRHWILYSKFPDQTRFSAVNWASGGQTNRLVFATLFSDEEKEKAEESLAHPRNSKIEFKWKDTRKRKK